ncbi:MAG: hypothetical protein HON53_01210 [Planctomycetaceae bacterium]|jgi:hypothetical protein|nr:hypothetical protein [Planctomycetaceae bacterium]MBT6154804.1 hypothetical protein [Planctomycetaceae bacterium]MBT6486671.1 hypothetical protein [Planctomycetaceae bacterium]MBT6493344.1 hypothetical protein [Planctomycetaceae bacterium]
MKRTVPLLIASVTGFVLIVAYFIPYTESWGDEVLNWFDIVAAFAFVLGAGNLLKMHLKRISDQSPGWGYSAVTALAFLITLVVGLAKVGVPPSEKFPAFPWSGSYIHEGGAFWWIYQYMFLPLSATMFAMLAFYIASAAFRAFRAKNVEAIILLVTAFIVLLGRTYAGVVLTDGLPDSLSFLRLEQFTEDTIMNVFNLAGTRAIMIGIGLGIVSTSLKVLLGVDRSYLGSE